MRSDYAHTLLIGALVITSGCGSTSPVENKPPPPAEALTLAQDLVPVSGTSNAAFLSVWSAGSENVWFAGGSTGDASGLIARLDGDVIRREPTPPGPLLWWLFGIDTERIWAVGEHGRILKRNENGWTDESPTLDERSVLWGVWGAGPNDLWAVGGSVRRNGPKGLVLRSDGRGDWTRIEDAAIPTDLNLYKVWGTAADNVYIVGEGGVVIHWDGTGFSRVDTGVLDLIFTVHGQTNGPIIAVGGLMSGHIFRANENQWVDESVTGTPGLNGVFVRKDGLVLATGNRGIVLLRSQEGHWYPIQLDARQIIGGRTLHAVLSQEHVWSVGGDMNTLTDGLIITDRRPLPRMELE